MLVLCMPSSACKSRVAAEPARDKTGDPYGDNIMSTVLPEYHCQTRHGKLKLAIQSLCTWVRLPATAEVFGLFSHLIPAKALTILERGKVPYFRLEMLSSISGTNNIDHDIIEISRDGRGPVERRLEELKFSKESVMVDGEKQVNRVTKK